MGCIVNYSHYIMTLAIFYTLTQTLWKTHVTYNSLEKLPVSMEFSPKRQQIQEKDKGQCFVKKRAQARYILTSILWLSCSTMMNGNE